MKLNAALPICLPVARGVFTTQPYCWVATEKPCDPPHLKYLLFRYFKENLAKSPFSAQHCDLCPSEERGFLACLFSFHTLWLLK